MLLLRSPALRQVTCLTLFTLLLLASCDSVPITGRKRSRFLVSEEQEVALGLQAYPELTKDHREITSGPQYEQLQRVMRRLIPYADPIVKQSLGVEFAWECKLLESEQANAWCLPGGKMAFYTGILPICQNEDGIAVVMGHEIGHAIASHSAERMTTEMIAKGVLVGTSLALGDDPEDQTRNGIILGALGLGAQYGVQMPFSREHESEADHIGLVLLVQAGYDPYESVRLWERMAKLGGGGPEFLSTHPSPANRAEALKAAIPEVLRKYAK